MESGRRPHPGQPHGGSGSPAPGQGDAQSGKRPRSLGPGAEGLLHSMPTRVIPAFPFPFDFFPLFFILTEELQHQGLCWSRQRSCLNNPGFNLFCFHLFPSELAGQRLIPIRQKISACCCTPGSRGAAGPGLHRPAPPSGFPQPASHAAHSGIPRQPLQHPTPATPAAPGQARGSAQPSLLQCKLFPMEELQVGKPVTPTVVLQHGRCPAAPGRGMQLRVSHLHKTKQSLSDGHAVSEAGAMLPSVSVPPQTHSLPIPCSPNCTLAVSGWCALSQQVGGHGRSCKPRCARGLPSCGSAHPAATGPPAARLGRGQAPFHTS